MESIRLMSTGDPLYMPFRTIYDISFPIYEQRTIEQQEYAFSFSHYHLDTYVSDGRLIGFIAYWAFDSYLYIEHFAIHPAERGKGRGKEILEYLMQAESRYILLEIDPVEDEVSSRRFHFYRSLGFRENPYPHIHPPYREGFEGHRLTILTSGRVITREEYAVFAKDLSCTVMNFKSSDL